MEGELIVRTPGGEYPVIVGCGTYAEALPGILSRLEPGGLAVVSHPSILDLHGGRLREALESKSAPWGEPLWFAFPEGEENKNLRTLEEGYRFLLRGGFTREGVILAFGGGVVGDLAGFLAATYMRGVRYLQLPTTLMAMVDSSIGGKVGVDLPEGKNAVGSFWQPEAVLADLEVLDTLPQRELLGGLAEVAKYGFLYDKDILVEMEGWSGGVPPPGYDLGGLVFRCAAHKARVVERDERDLSGERALLNYGHTFGHALESSTGYRLLRHGEAVALGMLMAARLSELAGLAEADLWERHRKILFPLLRYARPPGDVETGKILSAMEADKKRGRALRFVLLAGWQDPRLVNSLPGELAERAVDEVLAEWRRWGES